MATAQNLKLTPDPEPRLVTVLDIQPQPVRHDTHFDSLVTSIQTLGVLQPPVLREPKTKSGKYEIIAGRRRIAAAEQLGITSLICVVYPKTVDKAFIPSATIAENQVRSNNIGADIIAMGLLVEQGYDDAETVSDLTGLPMREVKKLMELRDLPRPILDGIVNGAIATTTASEVKKLRPQAMQKAIAILEDTGKLTANDIRKVREVQITDAVSQVVLPTIPELPPIPEDDPPTSELQLFKDSVIEILERNATDTEKIMAIRALVNLANFEVVAPQTIAQRVRNKKTA